MPSLFCGSVRPDGLGVVHELLVEGFELWLDDHVAGLVADREVLEDRQVEQAAAGFAGFVVGALVGIDEREGFVKCGHDVVDLVFGGSLPDLDLCSLFGDAGLLGLQDVLRHGVAVVELDELLLLGGEFAESVGVALALAAGDLGFVLDVLSHQSADVLALLGGEPVAGVDRVEVLLDEGGADVAKRRLRGRIVHAGADGYGWRTGAVRGRLGHP